MSSELDRLTRQLGFIVEIDKLKHIVRRSYVVDGSRRENDAEHSWHLAVMALLLREYSAAPKMDVLRVLQMILIHDLVEIHAGDTFLYDDSATAIKAEREKAAADELFSLLPDDQARDFRALWDEFEAGVSPESRYVRALDRLQPIMLNHGAEGRTWKEHRITSEMALELNPPVVAKGAPRLAEFARELLLDARERGYFHEL